MRIGVLALQGDYEAHARKLASIGVEHSYVRTVAELNSVDGLIIPGGETTTLLKFLERDDFARALKTLPENGNPIFGTCAGAILLASEVTNPAQEALGLMDMSVERNGYGRQLDSDIMQGEAVGQAAPVEMVFIRAPRIKRIGEGVEVLARCGEEIVCVRQGLCVAATFHPELSSGDWLHQYFAEMVRTAKPGTSPVAVGETAASPIV